MLVLAVFERRNAWLTNHIVTEAVLDAFLLFCIMSPIFYWFLMRPLLRSNKIKLSFLDMVSDGLRNPINALAGMHQASQEDPSLATGLHDAHEKAMQSLRLNVERIVTFSALEANALPQSGPPVDFLELCAEIEDQFDMAFAMKGPRFHIDYEKRIAGIKVPQEDILKQLVFLMLEISYMSADRQTPVITCNLLDTPKRRIVFKVDQEQDRITAHTSPCQFDRIELSRTILTHMVERAGFSYRTTPNGLQILTVHV